MSLSKMYSLFNHKTNTLYPEYIESRAKTPTGWVMIFRKCYPEIESIMYTAEMKDTTVDILDHKGNLSATFARLP